MHPRRRPRHPRHRPAVRGFTLIEMLVVISIIVILIGILVPVIGKVRAKAYEASTKAQIGAMSAVITQYFQDYKAYPGIVGNGQLRQATSNITNAGGFNVANMSMNENMFLSLCGGLEPAPSSTPAAPAFQVNRLLFGQGAKTLGAIPKKVNAYTDMTDVKIDGNGTGKFTDDDGTAAEDTVIPVFVDRFPGRMPLLILRARPQAPGVVTNSNQDAPAMQYDLDQIRSYTDTPSPIGVGRKIDASDYKGATFPQHGLRSVNELACIGAPPPSDPLGMNEVYPFDLYAALVNPSITRAFASPGTPGTNTPRQKDAYIIISAGIDRVYGTTDDITNFGNW
jgi:prepilin-type N-terminal cleavage/methylation domain-containing protein